jgi:hypothetical protein
METKEDDVVEEKTRLTRFREKLHSLTEFLFRWIFFWESDEKKLGHLIRFVHHSLIYITLMMYMVIHTFVPSYFLFCIFYGWILLVWLQHIVVGDCIFSVLEQRFLKDKKYFVDPILEIARIPVTPEGAVGVVVLGSTVVMFFLTFELLCRTILNIRQWFSL